MSSSHLVSKKLVLEHANIHEYKKITYTKNNVTTKIVPYKDRFLMQKTMINNGKTIKGKTFISLNDYLEILTKLENENLYSFNRQRPS